jgi:hypothetical protein
MTIDGNLAAGLLLSLDGRLRAIAPDLEVRGGGRWSAFYVGQALALMVRPEAGVAPRAIELASTRTSFSVRVTSEADLAAPDLVATLSDAIQAAREDRAPVFGFEWTAPIGRTSTSLGSLIGAVWLVVDVVQFLIHAPQWLRATLLSVPVWFGAAAVLAAATPSFSGIAWTSAAVALVISARFFRRRYPPTLIQQAETEQGLRENGTALGCLAMIAIFVGGLFLAFSVASALQSSFGQGATVISGAWTIVALGLLVGASVMVWRAIRRRFPPGPQSALERWVGRLLVAGVVAAVAWFVIVTVFGRASPLTQAQTTWCLGEGSQYVYNAIEALGRQRTWTDATAFSDDNFRSVCSLAWDVAHD